MLGNDANPILNIRKPRAHLLKQDNEISINPTYTPSSLPSLQLPINTLDITQNGLWSQLALTEEDAHELARNWLRTSMNHIFPNSMKHDQLWDKVAEHFNENTSGQPQVASSLKNWYAHVFISCLFKTYSYSTIAC